MKKKLPQHFILQSSLELPAVTKQMDTVKTKLKRNIAFITFQLLMCTVLQAQQLELASTSGPSGNGPVTNPGSSTFLLNTGTSTTFNAFTPAVTVQVSFSNQQYNSGSAFGLMAGATNIGATATSLGAITLLNTMGSVGGAVSTEYTSDPFGTAGTNFDAANDYSLRLNVDATFQNGNALNSRNYYGDMTITFSRPVSNPVLHFAGIGGGNSNNGNAGQQSYFSEFELSTADVTAGRTLTMLSGAASGYFNITADKILNSSPNPAAPLASTAPFGNQSSGNRGSGGSVRINTGSTAVTSVTFRVYLKGGGGVGTVTVNDWSGSARQGDAMNLSFSLGTVNISGKVYNDVNGLADNTINGSLYTASGLNAVLIDAVTNLVIATTPVSSGAYTFTNQLSTSYNVIITTQTATVGSAPPAVTIPTGFIATGEVNCGTTAGCTGSDGTADGALSLGAVSSSVTEANFGITQAGYIYLHKKTIDELSSSNFNFNVTGGPSSVGTIILNDSSETNIPVDDIGASQSGRLWAVGMNDNTLYYRDPGAAIWIATSVTNALRVDGAQGNGCYFVSTTNNVRYFDGTISTQIYNGGSATDIGCAWDGMPYIIANSGALYHYVGSGNGTHGSAIWPQVGTSTNNLNVDGDPVTGNAIVAKNEWHVWNITPAGVQTSLGRPAGSNSTSANDVAVDANGNIYAIYPGVSSVTGSNGAYPYRWISGTTWSADETTGGNSTPGSGNITAGVSGQVWLVNSSNVATSFKNGTIFSRTNNNGTIFWYDNDWVRTNSAISNAEMLAVIPGTYTITENLPAGWDLTAIDIYDPSNNSSGTVATEVSTINVTAGEVVHVNYTNAFTNVTNTSTSCGVNMVQNFSSGAATFGSALTGQTSYHYKQLNKVDDGYYTLIKNSSGWSNTSLTDHTNLPNGYFLAVNASYTQNEFYRQRVKGLIVGLPYTLSFWAADLSPSSPLRPNATMGVDDINTGVTVSSLSTGNITSTTWKQYSFTFTATNDTADIFIQNNAQGGWGNDIAIDDITFNLSPISAPVTTVTHNGCSAGGSIVVTSPVGSIYEYSINGTTFQSSTTFSNLAPGTYTVTVRYNGASCTATKQDVVNAAICGNVYNDANGLTDNTVNGAGTNAGTTLYAILYDNTTGKVVDSAVVLPDGTYSLDAATGNNYSVYLSTTAVTIGQTATPVVTLPSGWVNTGENAGSGSGNDGSANGILSLGTVNNNLSSINFGIEQPPVSPNQNYTITQPANNSSLTLNGTGSSSSPGPMSGNDPEDGALGNGKTFNIVVGAAMNGNKLFYNGVQITGAISIPNYNPALLTVQFTGAGSTSLSFVYQSFDAAGNGSNFANYTINWLSALPVKELTCTTVLNGAEVLVKWQTNTEINTALFYIERSTDGRTFTAFNTVQAAGTSYNIKQYSIADNITGLQQTVFYYRIKLVDTDGRITYSNTAVVKFANSITNVNIWPNPFSTALSIAVKSNAATAAQVTITDAAGKQVYTTRHNLVKGNNQFTMTDLQAMSKGIYFIKINNPAGDIDFVQKLVKQ